MRLFLIKNKKTGLYKNPEAYKKFSRLPKVWTEKTIRSALVNHIRYFGTSDDIEIIELVITENKLIPIQDGKIEL